MTNKGTTTVTVGVLKRGLEDLSADELPTSVDDLHQLADRSLLDFAGLAKLYAFNLAATSVSSACLCFSSIYTAPLTMVTTAGTVTKTVAVAKATTTVSTTVMAATV